MKCPHCLEELDRAFEVNQGYQSLSLDPDGHVQEWGANQVDIGLRVLCGECGKQVGYIENDQLHLGQFCPKCKTWLQDETRPDIESCSHCDN